MKVVTRLLAAFMIAALVLPAAAMPAMAAPSIDSMSIYPSSGPVGTEVTLSGSGNNESGYVYFALDTAYADSDWEKVLSPTNWDWVRYGAGTQQDPYYYEFDTDSFEIPETIGGSHRVQVVLINLGTTSTYNDVNDEKVGPYREFTVTPTIELLSQDEGPAGTEVEIQGTGFGYREEITVYFDDDEVELVDSITADKNGTWTGSFIVPPASKGSHDIAAGGSYTDEDDVTAAEFTVEPGISISPAKGIVGSEFTVKGSGFASSEQSIEIVFGSKSVKTGIRADTDGVFQTTVVVPAAAIGKHEVGAKGQSTSLASVETREFEIESQLLVEPLTGNVGTEVTVTGTGLPASTAVTVSYDGTTKGTGTTTADGTLSGISFTATHTQTTHTADHPIVAMFGSTSLTETFVMESTPPAKPTPRTPLSGTRIGIIGKQTPTLTWSVVDDPSGVTYGLQISATPDFSQILISKSGMVAQGTAIVVASTGPEMSYSLTEVEALPYGTYYWRVKAIDGAMNDSGWSASSTFKAGLLPSWALIVIIVLAAVLIAALIYVLIIRDRVGLYD
ncbi:MAG: IPT/TIG domain-containing protein [Dehalococcoidia bacterium]|nr:IPT/TIG domain-containing protein [Dehalococcoidia bacterium]